MLKQVTGILRNLYIYNCSHLIQTLSFENIICLLGWILVVIVGKTI